MACAAPHLRRYLDEFVFPLEPPPPHRNRPSTPCSVSARACNPPATATSSDNAPDLTEPADDDTAALLPASVGVGPPIPAFLPACLTAPGRLDRPEDRARNLERPINIWRNRNQREKPLPLFQYVRTLVSVDYAPRTTPLAPPRSRLHRISKCEKFARASVALKRQEYAIDRNEVVPIWRLGS